MVGRTTFKQRFLAISKNLKLRFLSISAWVQKLPPLIYNKLPKHLQAVCNVVKGTYTFYDDHDTSTLGAGLSYYMIFSIAPLLIMIISIVGVIYGPDAVNGALKQQIEKLLGANTAGQLQQMVKAAYQPGKNWIATALSVIFLITGAVGVFDQLRSTLNIVWDVEAEKKKPFFRYLVARLFSFGMIICIAFLLLVSLALSAALAGFSAYLSARFPALSKLLLLVVEFVLSFSLTSLLFAFIYKYMADIKIEWKTVLPGAAFTYILFAIGKYLIGIYISKSNLANTYGAASSVIVVLLWVYYSSQIVFLGAEFTRALAIERGIAFKNAEYNKAHKN